MSFAGWLLAFILLTMPLSIALAHYRRNRWAVWENVVGAVALFGAGLSVWPTSFTHHFGQPHRWLLPAILLYFAMSLVRTIRRLTQSRKQGRPKSTAV